MIVQVTNTGDDLHENHFDIAVSSLCDDIIKKTVLFDKDAWWWRWCIRFVALLNSAEHGANDMVVWNHAASVISFLQNWKLDAFGVSTGSRMQITLPFHSSLSDVHEKSYWKQDVVGREDNSAITKKKESFAVLCCLFFFSILARNLINIAHITNIYGLKMLLLNAKLYSFHFPLACKTCIKKRKITYLWVRDNCTSATTKSFYYSYHVIIFSTIACAWKIASKHRNHFCELIKKFHFVKVW